MAKGFIGVNKITTTSGLSSYKLPKAKAFQYAAEKIKKETGMLTGAVGLITNAHEGEQILKNQQADVIIMARQLLRDPYFPLHAAKELGADVEWPVQYERAKK